MADGHTRIGADSARIDGRLKVTGQAEFPSDTAVANPAYAYLITSAIARGRIKAFDLTAAEAVPGYLETLTFQNTQGQVKTPPAFAGESTLTLETDEIQHDGQIIAVVLADSYEAAREAAQRVVAHYDVTPATAGMGQPGATLHPLTDLDPKFTSPQKGDAAAAFAAAPVKIEAEYETAPHHHNQMELYTTTALWSDGKLTLHEPSQFVYNRAYIADAFGLQQQEVRVVSRFAGGGFGGKSSGTARSALIALASKRLGRPVKLAATRQQGFTIGTFRAETRHLVKLAANRDGKIQALIHEGVELTSRPSTFTVPGVKTTGIFYDYANVATKVSVVRADRNTPGHMRSPHELQYMFALESAMDELAYALKMDPVELRRLNDTKKDPTTGRPYSSRSLMECFDAAAAAFGWSKRNPEPGSMRDGDWLIGWGCASTCYPANLGASAARVSLTPEGRAKVQVAFHEIGQGAYTAVATVAADRLGLSIGQVSVELGDTSLPPGPLAAGSTGTATTCNAVAVACEQLRRRVAEAAAAAPDSLFAKADPAGLRFTEAGLTGPGGAEPLRVALGRLGGVVEAFDGFQASSAPPGAVERLSRGIHSFGGNSTKDFVAYSHGAQFVEVRINALTREIRTPRLVGAYAAGTIVSERTARSQMSGGMIWGVGAALHEGTDIDPRHARYVNTSFADYLIPVNADIKEVQVIFVPEEETLLNPMGIKGIGELGNVGMNAAVANAVFHATGKRVRQLPIRIEHLL